MKNNAFPLKPFLIDSQIKLHLHIKFFFFFVYCWLLLDCKREFHSFDHVLRSLELVWIYSMFSPCQSTMNDRGFFSIFLSISILQEDRQKIFACSTEDHFYEYFYSSSSSSSSRSSRSTRRIFQRAQIYYLNYSSSSK